MIRINKYIAKSGICSRRKADELILNASVSVNGKIVTDLGIQIDEKKDIVKVNGKEVKPSYEVKIGDKVEIEFGDKVSKFEIIAIPEKVGKNPVEMIKIL